MITRALLAFGGIVAICVGTTAAILLALSAAVLLVKWLLPVVDNDLMAVAVVLIALAIVAKR